MITTIQADSVAAAGTSAVFAVPAGMWEQSVFLKCSVGATFTLEASHDGTNFAEADPDIFPLAATANSIHYITNVPYIRVSWTANTGTVGATFSSM
jgi:hypothetical protein